MQLEGQNKMVKYLAHRDSKKIVSDAQIKEERLNVGEYSEFQGKIVCVSHPERSQICKNVGIEEEGEFAIKVR
jgi:RNA polymerase subunit RPABC4/transcription elongation factor Spt4